MMMGDATLPTQFFTIQSFTSLGSATAIVFVVANALQSALNFNPRWFALVLSILVGVFGTAILPSLHGAHAAQAGVEDYLIGVLNGFLIYTTAAGATAMAAGAGRRGGNFHFVPPGAKRGFTTSWF